MSIARTVTPTAIASPAFNMDPTTTEHDFRFPRRPNGFTTGPGPTAAAAATIRNNRHPNQSIRTDQRSRASSNKAGQPGLSTPSRDYAASSRMLGPALFPLLQHANADSDQSIAQLQQEDPLATQVWKFFARSKQELPHQDRMENLTWRMMAVGMRKHKQQMQQQKRYFYNHYQYHLFQFMLGQVGSKNSLSYWLDCP